MKGEIVVASSGVMIVGVNAWVTITTYLREVTSSTHTFRTTNASHEFRYDKYP